LRRRRSTRRWRRLREQLANPLFFWEKLAPGNGRRPKQIPVC
jgi:hypothetical protein